MFANERHNIIYEHIKKSGAVTTANLMKEFNVSIETVRRDLLTMEKKGMVKRVHGGAVEISEMKEFYELKERNQKFVREKRELSENAVKFVNENDIIFIDAGSTANQFAEVLKERFSKLTVITHSMDVFNTLCYHQNFNVILCAGHFNKKENTFYGSIVLDALNKIHAQKIFIFPSAVSMEFGICDYQEDFYQIQKQMLECKGDVYVLADSGKFEKKALLKLADMKKEYQYITDSNLPDELKKLYEENEINIFRGNENEITKK